MMRRYALLPTCLAVLLSLTPLVAWGQAAQRDDASLATRIAREQSGLIGLMAGGPGGTYIRIAADLAAVLDDGESLRILPIVGRGSVQNVADLLYTRGVDLAIVQSDVLAQMRRQTMFPNQAALQYIAKLYEEEVHVLVRQNIAQLRDLADKPVNVDVRGSGTAMTAATLFGLLSIAPKLEHDDQPVALERLRRGDIAALVYVTGGPASLFTSIEPGSGLRFLPVTLSPELAEAYLPSRLDHALYPNLIPTDGRVDTVAVGAVLATVGATQGTDRYRRMARFTEAFFTRFEELRRPGRHPKWTEVNLAAQIPGWSRFPEAQTQLNRQVSNAEVALKAAFNVFLSDQHLGGEPDAATKQALFQEFLKWQARKEAGR
jgi:TRAP transporter TAXI family solute receptor